jgi:hypothetical protein
MLTHSSSHPNPNPPSENTKTLRDIQMDDSHLTNELNSSYMGSDVFDLSNARDSDDDR